MQIADGNDAAKHIGALGGVGLMEHALVACARGAGLIGVDTRDDDQLVRDLIRDATQSADIVQNRFAVVGGAGSDDQQNLVAPALKNRGDLRISCRLDLLHFGGKGVHFLDVLRDL